MIHPGNTIVIAGASGFVGSAVWPAMEQAGYRVRGLTRSADRARRDHPERYWREVNLETGLGLEAALDGAAAAVYLVHGMSGGDPDYRRRERETARLFASTAGARGLRRIIYLGGVAPAGEPSEHLASRLEVGRELMAGPVPCLELRASMIVGYGSASWWIVRDLAARLPAMVVPRWLRTRTEPVAIDDVVVALVRGLQIDLPGSASYDLPGPDVLSMERVLSLSARALGLRPPVMVEVPVLTPWLSSHWIRLVTRAQWSVARELVQGLTSHLVARDDSYWERIGHTDRLSFTEAARRAVEAERDHPLQGLPAFAEDLVRRVHPAGAPRKIQ